MERIGGREHVRARAVLELRAQLLRPGEAQADLDARVRALEVARQGRERVAQRGRGEDEEPRLAGRRPARAAARACEEGQPDDEERDEP